MCTILRFLISNGINIQLITVRLLDIYIFNDNSNVNAW